MSSTTNEIISTSTDGKDFVSANRDHFNQCASHDEDKRSVELAKRAAKEIINEYDFDEKSTTVMDFACNIGLLARELAPHTKQIIGVDISEGAVRVFNERVFNQGIPPEEMRAVCVELKGEDEELDGQKFDVVICTAAYHHFEDIDSITKTLSFFLKPDGQLFVIDITQDKHHKEHHHGNDVQAHEQTPGHGHGHGHGHGFSDDVLFPEKVQHIVPHKYGISREAIETAFKGAGLCSITFRILSTITIDGKEGKLFFATGTKPSPSQ